MYKTFSKVFRLSPQYVLRPPVIDHLSLHSKPLGKDITRAYGGANIVLILSSREGGTNGKNLSSRSYSKHLIMTPKYNKKVFLRDDKKTIESILIVQSMKSYT